MMRPTVLPRPDAEELPIAEAARRLGVSTEAIRKRVSRGTLAGHKRGQQWYVVLAPAPPSGQASGQPADTSGRRPSEPSGQTDTASGQQPDALVEQLRSEVAFLRRLTEHQAATIMEQARQLATRSALPAPEMPVTASETTATPPAAVDLPSDTIAGVERVLRQAKKRDKGRRWVAERVARLLGLATHQL